MICAMTGHEKNYLLAGPVKPALNLVKKCRPGHSCCSPDRTVCPQEEEHELTDRRSLEQLDILQRLWDICRADR